MARQACRLMACMALVLVAACTGLAHAATDTASDAGQLIAPAGEATGSRVPDIFQDVTQIERIDPDTTRAIVRKFAEANPAARKYPVNAVSQGFEEDESSPALKLNQVWIGTNSVLLELTGLPRKGKSISAVMRRDTLRIRNSKGAIAQLLAFEGVTELRDRRGGSALIVNPGDTLYLLFDKFDDYYAYSLSHINRDGKESVYFDRLDPHFRDRYDAMHAAATTPAAMKDFVVEFARNDPDNRVLRIFSRLLGEMRAQKSFDGYHAAYRLIGDPKDYDAMQRAASTVEQKAVIRAIEEEKQAEIRRREEAKLAESRREEAARMAAQQAEQARAAEQRCLSTPSCLQAIEDRKAVCVQSVQNCRSQCDTVAGAGSQSSFFGNLAAAGLARVCYSGCKCDNNFGDLIARFNQAVAGETSAVRASNSPRPSPSPSASPSDSRGNAQPTNKVAADARISADSADKDFVCTVYCNSPTGPTIRRDISARSRSDAAKAVGGMADQLCRDSGHARASMRTLPEGQCVSR